MTDSVRVEAASMDDVDAVTDCWVALVADQRDHGAHLLAEANRTVANDVIAQYVHADGLAVARQDARIVGFVMYHVESGLYDQDATRGIVDNVYVTPDARSAGVGTRLLDHAETSLTEDGADVLAISVMAANDDARRLYEQRGYEPHRLTLEKPTESDTHSKDDR